jgi:CAAX prenyl protease-like protein
MLPYVLPFLLYVIPTTFESSGVFGLSYEFLCTMKGVMAAIALGIFWKRYAVFRMDGVWWGVICGIVGLLLWVGLDRVQSSISLEGIPGAELLKSGLLPGERVGFNPLSAGGPSAAQLLFVLVRMLEMMLIVPLVEEFFWRGFLSRYLISEQFQSVAEGAFTRWSFLGVTVIFALMHTEILAALAWCALINTLYWYTRNIWSCVVMHGVTNGLLVVYILLTANWHLW